MTTTSIRAVAYYRMSRDLQEASIPRQRESVEAYAKVNGYEIIREYKDEGISGDATERRAGFLAMREAGTRGEFEVILCWDKDRFGRFDSIEQGYWVKPLRDAGVRLVTVTQGLIDWNSFAGRIVDTALAESKHEFLRTLSQSTTAGKIRVARGAYFNGGVVPYAFDRLLLNEHDEPQMRVLRGQVVTRQRGWHFVLIPCENAQEVETIRWLFRSFADRDVSCRQLAEELNARGIPSLTGGKWTRQAISAILENHHYVGDSVWGQLGQGKYCRAVNGEARPMSGLPKSKGGRVRKHRNVEGLIVCRDAHDGLIDRALWDLVQAKLASRRREQRFPRGTGYVLAGLLVCGHCGKRMYGCTNHFNGRKGRKSYRRYVCTSYNSSGPSACGSHQIREDKLVPFLIRKLQQDYLAPEKLEALKAELLRQLIARQEGNPEKAERLRARLASLDAEIREGARNVLRAGPHIDLVTEALTELRDQRAKLAHELQALERSMAVPLEDAKQIIKEAVEELRHLRERLKTDDVDELREVFRRIISSIVLYFEAHPKRVKVYHRLIKGVVKLRPQLDVRRIKDCQDCDNNPPWMGQRPQGRVLHQSARGLAARSGSVKSCLQVLIPLIQIELPLRVHAGRPAKAAAQRGFLDHQ
jgi:DNA invertase Pin-like site-specific DNA recombinase